MAETKARELAELARNVDDSNITVGTGKTLDVSGGTLTLADNQISGDKVEGGTIEATTITSLTTGTISEAVADAGVSIDGVVAKDSKLFAPSGIVFASAEITGDDAGTTNRVESSNLLDDYEEGTFAPTSKSGVDMSSSSGSYTKVGSLVFLNFRIVFNTEISLSQAQISLPFIAKTEPVSNAHHASFSYCYTTYGASLHAGVKSGTNNLDFFNGSSGIILYNELSQKQINGSVVYHTA